MSVELIAILGVGAALAVQMLVSVWRLRAELGDARAELADIRAEARAASKRFLRRRVN